MISMQVLKQQMEELGQINRVEFAYDGDEAIRIAIKVFDEAIENYEEGTVI